MIENALTYFLLWYVVMGLISAVIYWYASESAPIEEFALVWLLWFLILIMIIYQKGIDEVVRTVFTDNKKGFAGRLLVVLCILVILYSVVSILA